MNASGAGLCLTVLLICVIDTLVEGNSWRRHHSHHSRLQNHGSMSLDLLPKHSRNNEDHSRHRDIHRQRERHGHLEAQADSFPSLEYEDAEEVQTPVVHRHQQVLKNSRQESLQMKEADTRSKYEDDATGMRHVKHSNYLEAQADAFPSSEYEDVEVPAQVVHRRRQVGQDSYHMLEMHRLLEMHKKKLSKLYELEVREVQNGSVCSYTVVPIPDNTGSRMPKVLEHIKCNNAGSNCLGTNTHCCIQTYKKIEVSYGDGSRDIMKLYVGCVCALHVLLQEQRLPIDN